MIDAAKFLEDVSGRFAAPYEHAIRRMVIAMARGNDAALESARAHLADVVRESMGFAEILGSMMVLQRVQEAMQFAGAPAQRILPAVTFQDALDDMVTRAPVTIRDAAERSAQRISELYGKGRVVAFAKSAESAVTEEVQRLIADAIRRGGSEAVVGKRITMSVESIRQATEPWTQAYARMAFRTNLGTATTAGQFRQVQDPVIRAITPAFRFDAVGDVDTRPNHMAADGRVYRVNNPVWSRIAPPLGYNCRCRLTLQTTAQLQRAGRINGSGEVIESSVSSQARPDPGFRHGGRPDLMLSGS